jgi:hypothetical protein
MHFYKVYNLESCTENPCVGGSIPPLGTTQTLKSILSDNFSSFILLEIFVHGRAQLGYCAKKKENI